MTLWRCLAVLILALLAGCGFQLRGASVDEGFLNVSVVSSVSTPSGAYANFLRSLEAAASRRGGSQEAEMTLRVQGFAFEVEDGAVDAQVRVVEKIARVIVEVAPLDSRGRPLAEPWVIELSQAFRADRTQLLGSFEQQSQVESALYQRLADRLLRSAQVLQRMGAKDSRAAPSADDRLPSEPDAG